MGEKNISWSDVLKKLLSFLKSMQFSIIILSIILIACIIGSVLPQGKPTAFYAEAYGTFGTSIIRTLQLDRIFSCRWFFVLSVLLCLNLTMCSVSRFPGVLKRYKTGFSPDQRMRKQDASFSVDLPEDFDPKTLGLRNYGNYLYIAKNRAGLWGSWLCHLGMLLVIVGFALGQMLSKEFVVYGIAGSTQPVGNTGMFVTIDDFQVIMRDDFTVEQYLSTLTVSNGHDSVSSTAAVNHPMSAFGYSFYQDSTGWANYIDISYEDELLRQDLLCVGEHTYPDQLPNLVFQLNRFYPDLVETESGYETATPLLNNPHSLYSVFYNGKKLSMGLTEMGQPVQLDKISFTLHDPVQYTLLVIKTDPTAALVGIASLLMVVGILLAFYCRPYELWSDGKTLWGKSQKAPELLKDSITERLGRMRHHA